MKRLEWPLRAIFFLLLAVGSGMLLADARAGEPLTAFRLMVAGPDLAVEMKRIDPENIIRTFVADPEKFPEFAARIGSLDQGSHADEIGVVPESLCVKKGGMLMVLGPSDLNTAEAPPYEAVWIDPAGNLRKHITQAGHFGIWSTPQRNVAAWYLAHGARDARWDHEVLAALMSLQENPDVAESFWAMAIAKGYQADRLSNLCGMAISLERRDAARTAAFAEAFGPLQRTDALRDVPHWSPDWEQVAALTGDPKWLLTAADRFTCAWHGRDDYAAQASERARIQAAVHAALPANLPPPSVLAERMKHRSFLAKAQFNSSWAAMDAQANDQQVPYQPVMDAVYQKAVSAAFAGLDHFPADVFQAPLGGWRHVWLGPPTAWANMDASIRFLATPELGTPGKSAHHGSNFTFGLANRNASKYGALMVPPSARILVAQLYLGTEHNRVHSWRGFIPGGASSVDMILKDSATTPCLPMACELMPAWDEAAKRPHTLRVVRVGKQAEAILDGKRLALVQVPDGLDDPGVFVHVSGATVSITQFTADLLE